MEIVLVILMSFTAVGIAIFAISKQEKSTNKVFKYTSFEDEQNIKHVFLVHSPSLKLAQKDAIKMINLKEIEIEKVEELDSKTLEVVDTPFIASGKSFVKIKKIT